MSVMLWHRRSQLLSRTNGPLYAVRTSVAYFSDNSASRGQKPSSGLNGGVRIGGSVVLGPRNVNDSKGEYQQKGSVSAENVRKDARSSIETMFSDRNVCDGAMFDSFVQHRLNECDVGTMASLFRLSGRKSKSKSYDLLKKHLPAIASRLQTLSSSRWRFMEYSFVIYGLQCIGEKDAGYVTVLSIMTSIADRMLWDDKAIRSQNISMMLFGLQRNRCEETESVVFIKKATVIISKCTESLNAQSVGNALYGMQGLSSDSVEVCALLSALAPKVASCTESLNAQSVGNALYGMQGLSSDSVEVCALLSALAPKVASCTESLDAQAVGNALYGLRFLFSYDAIGSLTEVLLVSIGNLLRNIELLSRFDLLCLGQGVALCLSSLRESLSIDKYAMWDRANVTISDELCRRNNVQKSALDRAGQMYPALSKLFHESSVLVSYDEHLFNLFHTDIVIRMPYATGGEGVDHFIINIDVYSKYSPLSEKKKRFRMRRDDYLKSRGIHTARIELSMLKRMSDKDIEEWIMNMIAHAVNDIDESC